MAPRSFWKGYLKLSLVTCPVAMTPAISEGEKVRFHTLNRATGNRIQSRYVDAETGEPVDEDDEIKGYQSGADEYVPLEEEEIESVALESTRTIDIETFVPRNSIGWVWYDRPHYLVPDEPWARRPSRSSAMPWRRPTWWGYPAGALPPGACRDARRHGKGIVLWTLRYGDEVRDPAAYFGDIKAGKVDPKLKALVAKLIEERTKPWDPKMVTDPVQEQLLQIIAAKKKGKRVAKPKKSAEPASNVVSIMDALRRSIRSETKSKGR